MRKIILSGIAPSGNLHIGNYLGALKQWVDLQKDYTVFAMVADLHAITVPQDSRELSVKTLEVAKILIASGIDPGRSVVFLQSQVSAHAELAWILNTLTPVGELERMTQFKEKKEKSGVLAGLLNYPTLMAADILLYQSDLVPVGEDQGQHLELTRALARKFNNRFGETFKEPKALILKETARIMALDDPTKKMSKSDEHDKSRINLMDSPDEIRNKIKGAVTDSQTKIEVPASHNAPHTGLSNLLNVYAGFTGMGTEEIYKKYDGQGYAEFKKDLAEVIINGLKLLQDNFQVLSKDKRAVLDILRDGAKKAALIAEKTLHDAKKKVGFVF